MPPTTNAGVEEHERQAADILVEQQHAQRWIGLTSSKSTVPLRSMLGMKNAVMMTAEQDGDRHAPSRLTRKSSIR